MTEVLFYQLKGQTPEQVLPALLQRSLDRGWRVVVQASSQERVDALDAHFWTWRDDAFLPHGTWRDSEAAEHPVLLTLGEDNPNGAVVRFLIEGAAMPQDVSAYERIVFPSTGRMPRRLRRRAGAGARPKRPVSRSLIGRRMKRASGGAKPEPARKSRFNGSR